MELRQFAAARLKTEADSRDSHGGQGRIKAARFPARKTLEEFDFSFQTSIRREQVLHLGQLDFLAGRENLVLLGPPGTGKSHLAIAIGIRACLAGHRVAFRTATEWVALLADAQRSGRLDDELTRLQRIPLLIVDLRRHRDYADTVLGAAAKSRWRAGFWRPSSARLSA